MQDTASFLIKEANAVAVASAGVRAGMPLLGGALSWGKNKLLGEAVGKGFLPGAKAVGGKLWSGFNSLSSLMFMRQQLGEYLGGNAPEPAGQPGGQAGQPGGQGFGGYSGHPDDSGYIPFSSRGIEDIRQTPRYQMGSMPMYGQQSFVHQGSAKYTAKQRLAFEHGVDLFCKQADFDEEDRLAMHALIKKAGVWDNFKGNMKSWWGAGDNPVRQNDPAYWMSEESREEQKKLNTERQNKGKHALSAKDWSNYFTGSAQRAASQNTAAADELAKQQSGEFGKGHWAARGAIAGGVSAPFLAAGGALGLAGTAATTLGAAVPDIYQNSKDKITPNAAPGVAPGQATMSSTQPNQGASVPAFDRLPYLPTGGFGWDNSGGGTSPGGGASVGGAVKPIGAFTPGGAAKPIGAFTPGGTANQKPQAPADNARSSLDNLKAQQETFAAQGRARSDFSYQTALNQVYSQGDPSRIDIDKAILQASRGNPQMVIEMSKHFGRPVPGGFKRYDPSAGTSNVTRPGATGTATGTADAAAPRASSASTPMQGVGVPPAPAGASQVPGGWVARSEDNGAETARRDLQRHSGTNAFFRSQGQNAPAQNSRAAGLAEAAGMTGSSSGAPTFEGSFEDYEKQRATALPSTEPPGERKPEGKYKFLGFS